ncbi:Tegument antigen [Clonorchis sinensis]|uniref:Tegument antigen n=2 Tax=Clonorchis sinensis TaxID=79923 RepID=A0A3R7C972_CLOSI|nr:Tegument antigen [Clonorchis sinensis]
MTQISAEDRDFLILLYYKLEELKGTVVTAEYEEMLLKYDFTTTSARKVASQFDPERQKIITREQIYRVLNCPGNYMPKMSVPRDISILSSDMGPYLQYFVIHMARKIMKYLPDMKEVVSRIKMRLDSLYGPLWHVFIVRGQYWAYYSHDTRTGLVFKKDDLIYLMYRSPTAE